MVSAMRVWFAPLEDRLEPFAACWDDLAGPRSGNAGLHDFHELPMTALCAVLCGGQGAVDMARFAPSARRQQGARPRPPTTC